MATTHIPLSLRNTACAVRSDGGTSALRVPNFRLFAATQATANAGTWIQRTAQDWLVLELTGSAVAVAVAVALQCLPALLFGLWGGSVADRYPRRRILMACPVVTALLALALAVAVLGHCTPLWSVYGVAVLLGLVSVVETPARQAFVPELVDRHLLRSAVSVNSAGYQLGRLAGPALAGVLIGVCGTGWTFLLCALTSLLCLGALLFVRTSALRAVPSAERRRSLEAVHYVKARPQLLWTLVLVGLMGLLGSNFAVLLPSFSALGLQADPSAFGLLSTLLAVGSFGGALVAARLHGEVLRVLAGSALTLGVLEATASLCTGLWAFGALLVPIGVCALAFSTTANSSVQLCAEPHVQGRVSGLYVVVLLGGAAVGAPLAGAVVRMAGPRLAFLIAGMCCLTLAVLAMLVGSRLRRRHGRAPARHADDAPPSAPSGAGSTSEDEARLQAMAHIAQIMAEEHQPDQALRAAAAAAGRALQACATVAPGPPETISGAFTAGHAQPGRNTSAVDGPTSYGVTGAAVPEGPDATTRRLTVPVVMEGRARGRILLVRGRRRPPFTPNEAAFAHALALQLSAGLTQLAHLQHIRRLAFTDALTGLANRRAADLALQDAVERHQSDGTVVSLIVCDLNGLKRVNDTEGHEAGDRLLKEFATRLESAARTLPGCLAARVGGDEFCVIAGGRRASDVMAVAERIVRDARRLGHGDGVACGVASAPGTLYPRATPETLFHQADAAQYHAKQARARRPVLAARWAADGDATAAPTARTPSCTPAPVAC